MPYKVYYGNTRVKIYNDNHLYTMMHHKKEHHIWPKDNTQISLSISGDTLSYSISNLSDRTKYLYDNGLLGLGIFVEENPSWISQKDWWRSVKSKERHLTRHCVRAIRINSLSGTVDLNTIQCYNWNGCLSKSCYYVFNYSGNYREPYVSEGTERVAIGVGRMYNIDENVSVISCFRPHKMSEYYTIQVFNKL